MDRHSFFSALPFLVPSRCPTHEEDDDPFVTDPAHVILRDHELSVETVDSQQIVYFDTSGVSCASDDPALTACLVYSHNNTLCFKIKGRLYYVDWSQMVSAYITIATQQPLSLVMDFGCCLMRFFSLQPSRPEDDISLKEAYHNFVVKLTECLAESKVGGAQAPGLLRDEHYSSPSSVAQRESIATTATTTSSSNASNNSKEQSSRKRKSWQMCHEELYSLITALELPALTTTTTTTTGASASLAVPHRDVFHLLNSIADDLSASYLPPRNSRLLSADDEENNNNNHAAAGPWMNYFPAPRSKQVPGVQNKKEEMLTLTREWMQQQKYLLKQRQEMLLLPTRG